jgi:hypothetical protein
MMSIRAMIERVLSPGIGYCYRCKRPWRIDHRWGTPYHETRYEYDNERRGCFPLCESCWTSLTPETRLPYYRRLYESWVAQTPSGYEKYVVDWPTLREAVLTETVDA